MESKLLPTAGIFIPTMNRVDFVIRQLRYYASVQCPHTIYIGDSSPKAESERIANEIKKLDNKIKAKYYYLPGYDSWQSHFYLISEIKEKYICYSGDDDYQIPGSITKCIEFLETHPEYTSASGYAVSFKLKEAGPYGDLKKLADYPRQQIEDNTASERIINFFTKYYVTHFSVNRTREMVEHWQSAEKIIDHHFKSEILPTSLPLVSGKSKIIDCLSFVRQLHDRRHNGSNTYDWITSPDWYESYKLFEYKMAENISKKDGISLEEGVKTIRRAFWAYLQKYLAKEYNDLYSPKKEEDVYKNIKSLARANIVALFPSLKYVYRMQIRPRMTGKKELNYEVLQPKSKYYQDFKPVIDSLTNADK